MNQPPAPGPGHPPQHPQPGHYPPQGQPQQPGMHQPPGPAKGGGMKVLGIALLAVGGLLFLGAAFFGFMSWKNYGSAERLGRNLPPGAEFVVKIVEKKAEKQSLFAGGLGAGAVVFLGLGAVFALKKR